MVDTLFNGGMVNLKQLLLADNIISNAGSESLADALKRGALAKLRKLSLSGNALMDHAVIHLK
jgi:Ran GTPase-activating protein (RanGAP) involved in mRNA processing and transport